MEEFEREIMVVNNQKLFSRTKDRFEGFRSHSETDFETKILSNFSFMKRALAEKSYEHKQPIGYVLIINPKAKKIFSYQRSSKDSQYKEKRLQGKWSWGVGGHIEKFDAKNINPIKISMLREIEEEVDVGKIKNIRVLGYVNNEKDDVSKVHFGILYLLETDSENIKPKGIEFDEGRLRTIKELEEIANSGVAVEEWSKIALEPIKKYFEKI